MKQILIAEDDPSLGFLLKENLESHGMAVTLCKDGEEAQNSYNRERFSLCIIDVMMPKIDGFSLAKQIRAKDQHIPIIFLTAKNLDEDKIKGFECGCDDYITKPFSARELLLRIQAIWRRLEITASYEAISFGIFTLDPINRLLSFGNTEIKLSNKENELLKILAGNKNQLLNRNLILREVWGNDDYFTSRSMDVYIAKLRKLLKNDSTIELQNVHGSGFRLLA